MKAIYKKCLPHYFQSVVKGEKNFEIRKDEDHIEPGDLLVLCEFDGWELTGEEISRHVKYVLRNVPEYGLMPGYCIFLFKKRKEKIIMLSNLNPEEFWLFLSLVLLIALLLMPFMSFLLFLSRYSDDDDFEEDSTIEMEGEDHE